MRSEDRLHDEPEQTKITARRRPPRSVASPAKRIVDAVGAAAGLAGLSPFLLAIAALIRLDSRGPALFKQTRLGLGGRPFTVYKFRSMRRDADHAPHRDYVTSFILNGDGHSTVADDGTAIYKLTGDDRITRVGLFLRKTSLDELPQLINVLKGEMSLVGPRPPVEYEAEVYNDTHRRRLSVVPGITGLWQVSGRCELTFEDMVRLDLIYIDTWSFWLDLKILFKTIQVVLTKRGAW